ncbi:EboA domain-containing protein [Tamlana sp. 2201CG12-4]|uniref:EboA domain-containing protein n=1 Tax=Tamlana sp. 2201CG12-4 TaxID=3112582 RepID=UPI002DBEDE10|nr:EboA domain-containing protein [Tamlana sp. 2201CG12-4]MEC3905670.1 EboA domain-containing protein [Tamlana sp. 2201CG12-4]
MISVKQQDQFVTLTNSKFTPKELEWIEAKSAIISTKETSHKFNVFFSLAARFISSEIPSWNDNDLKTMENIYPGFGKGLWTKQDLARVRFMIALDVSVNKSVLSSFFEIAEMKEEIALYKGLFLLKNAASFRLQYAEGIRTNMSNVFDAIASGNPFAQVYLSEDEWNQLILKSFFMDRKLYPIQHLEQGKNEKLAHMLQDYVKERWAAGRQVSLEIWRMIDGYLREDIKKLMLQKTFKNSEKQIINKLLQKEGSQITIDEWDAIGKLN